MGTEREGKMDVAEIIICFVVSAIFLWWYI
jgi:hypothetical protein